MSHAFQAVSKDCAGDHIVQRGICDSSLPPLAGKVARMARSATRLVILGAIPSSCMTLAESLIS